MIDLKHNSLKTQSEGDWNSRINYKYEWRSLHWSFDNRWWDVNSYLVCSILWLSELCLE